MFSVAVILGTYNGEKYLQAQINSILGQVGVSVQIYARDDGSNDSTLNILRSYAISHTNFHLLNDGNTINKGIKYGFMETLEWALSDNKSDFFAFSDQDDIWLPEKLITGIESIKDSLNANGALYYSNKTITDETLQILKQEHFEETNDFSNFLFVSRAYGCTIVMNRKLAQLCCQYVSKHAHYHDDWIHRLAICLNSDISFGTNSYILYRQHGDNNCGTWATDNKPFFYLVKRAFSFFKNNDGYNRSGFANDILEHYDDRLNDEIKIKLTLIANYKKSFRNKIRLLNISLGNGRKWIDVFLLKIKILIGYL